MAHPFKHAESSARKFGGKPEDYLAIHNWFDESKSFFTDFRHRALRHHAEGIFLAERIFGVTIINSDGERVPVRYVGEQHVKEDLGRIPTAQDWLSQISPQRWMYGHYSESGIVANASRASPLKLSRRLLIQARIAFLPTKFFVVRQSLLVGSPNSRKTEVLVNPCVSAIQHLRPLRGGAQSHLLRASDGACYVTKFQNNPQHIRVLANEMLATKLGLAIGLPMPRVEVIEVSDWLIEQTEDLRISLGGAKIPCQSGKQLGSLYVGGESPGMSFDYLPRELLQRVANIGDFPWVLVLDKWTCNSDGRQAIFCRKALRSQRHTATFIDQGYCFNAGEWTFPDSPLRGAYANNCVYERVMGWEAFEPALSRAEEMDAHTIWRCAAEIPEEWYEGDRIGLEQLVETLCHRRQTIRKLIGEFRRSSRNPFPNWRESPADSVMPLAARDRSLEAQRL